MQKRGQYLRHINDKRTEQVPEKGLSYIRQGAFAIYVEIYEKSFSTVAVMVPGNVVLIVKNVS